MRGYADLAPEMQRSGKEPPGFSVDRAELRKASMPALCPGAFDGYRPLEEPRAIPVLDPGQRLRGATEVDEGTARARSGRTPQRVLSVVLSGGGAGSEAYGASGVKVVVPGYRPGAEAYYLSGA